QRVNLTEGGVVPKPAMSGVPVFGTGYSGQTMEWLAEHTDGWLFYPQNLQGQKKLVNQWRGAPETFKPFAQPLAIDLLERPGDVAKQLSIVVRSRRDLLVDYLNAFDEAGVNHVMIALKQNKRPAEEVIQVLGEYVVTKFLVIIETKYSFLNFIC